MPDPPSATPPAAILPGIWRTTLGQPEAITPVKTRRYPPSEAGLRSLPTIETCPVEASGSISERGCLVRLPLAPGEMVYGLGLQFGSFLQRGLKKTLRVNADPKMDSGDSHAPVPFYVTTRGYGVLIDTARYATFYCGGRKRRPDGTEKPEEGDASAGASVTANALPAAYVRSGAGEASEMLIEIPRAAGVDVYVFAGPTLREAVQRYNLFSGGGALPPRWGLGFWYRCQTDFSQGEVLDMASGLRERGIPCDVLGLEPRWQTHAYSCSFAWNDRFPDPPEMLKSLADDGYRVNLWEHAFTHPTSPIYDDLLPHSGDFEVWGGIVPDFLDPDALRLFADFHESEHVAAGVSGYKLDECDNSDFTGSWSFPEISRFPSGADGEQMHSLLGLRYLDAIQTVFDRRGEPTYGLVRSAQALAAPYPYALYSDLYDHREFIHAVAQSSFAGLLWTPEVRHATGPEDLLRRLQSVVFSPLAMVNAWYLKHPPWKQMNRGANNAGEFAPDWETMEAQCREIIEWRMRFVPYLHAAFVRYHREGIPPFRALVMDYPDDPEMWSLSDQYLMGDDVLAAPIVAGKSERTVYLPSGGDWHDFWTGERFVGGQRITVTPPREQIPLFVRSGTLLPLARVTLHTGDPASRELTVRAYGDDCRSTVLYEGSDAPASPLTEVRLTWNGAGGQGTAERDGAAGEMAYRVVEWQRAG